MRAAAAASPRRWRSSRRAAGAQRRARPLARPPAGSTLDATLVDRDGDGFLERRPGRAADRPRRPRPKLGRRSDDVRAAHRHPRARRGVARAGAVPGPHRRPVHVDLPPAGGVLHPDARRGGPRAQPRAAAGRLRHRRHHRQRAARTSSTWRSTTLDGRDASIPTAAPRATTACRTPTPPTRSTTAPTTTPPPTPARSSRPRGLQGAGAEGALVPARRQPRRARPGRGPARRRRSTPSRPATGSSRAWTRTSARRRARSTPGRPSRRCSPAPVPLDSVPTPADPDRLLNAPGEAERRLGAPGHGLHGRPRAERPRDPDRHRQPRRHQPGADHPAADRMARDGAGRHATAGSSSSATTRSTDERCASSTTHPQGRREHRRQLAHRTASPARRPLLADRHVLARRLPPAGAHVPAARDRPAASRWRPGWSTTTHRPGRHLARARLPRRTGRATSALRRRAGRPQRATLLRGRNRNTSLSVRYWSKRNREEKYVNTRAFLGGLAALSLAAACSQHGRRSGTGEPVRLAVGEPHAAGQHHPRDGLHRRPRLRHRRRRNRPAHRRRRRQLDRSRHRHLAGPHAASRR